MLDNVALVVLEEHAPGSQAWYTWRDVLHLVDIACCMAILFPIVWSIRHLRQAAAADGKAEHNLMKLTLFRQFYIMVCEREGAEVYAVTARAARTTGRPG